MLIVVDNFTVGQNVNVFSWKNDFVSILFWNVTKMPETLRQEVAFKQCGLQLKKKFYKIKRSLYSLGKNKGLVKVLFRYKSIKNLKTII